jgi:mRNA interferase RelE/StbE
VVYTIEFAPSVVEYIPTIPVSHREQIKKAVRERLTQEPIKLGKPLRGSLFGYRRLRVGDWRIIYKVSGNTVRIAKIGNRKDVYDE